MDIRLQTHLIVKKGNEYLQGRSMLMRELIWCSSPWDAWRTRSRKDAERVLQKVGGELVLFNPVAWQIKELEG